MKRPIALLVAVIVPLLLSHPALASGPTVTRFPAELDLVDSSCGFDVHIQLNGTVIDLVWPPTGGQSRQFLVAPEGMWTLTNLTTGRSITQSLAGGPQRFTTNADGSFAAALTGVQAWLFNPETDAPGLFTTWGRVAFSFDQQGNLTSFKLVGHLIDMCAELAG